MKYVNSKFGCLDFFFFRTVGVWFRKPTLHFFSKVNITDIKIFLTRKCFFKTLTIFNFNIYHEEIK